MALPTTTTWVPSAFPPPENPATAMAVYVAVAPVLMDGQQYPLRTDSSGNLLTTAVISGSVTAALSGSVSISGGGNTATVTASGQLNVLAGLTAIPTATMTRPATTTIYSAAQIIGQSSTAQVTPMVFVAGRYSGDTGLLTYASLTKSSTGNTNATFRLHLFDAAVPTLTALTDYSSYATPKIADYTSYMGYADFPTGTVGSDGVWFQATLSQPTLAFACASSSTAVYGVMEVTGAYTPAASEVFDVRLGVLQN